MGALDSPALPETRSKTPANANGQRSGGSHFFSQGPVALGTRHSVRTPWGRGDKRPAGGGDAALRPSASAGCDTPRRPQTRSTRRSDGRGGRQRGARRPLRAGNSHIVGPAWEEPCVPCEAFVSSEGRSRHSSQQRPTAREEDSCFPSCSLTILALPGIGVRAFRYLS